MVDVSAIALSGLHANERRLAVAAENVANAATEGYKPKEVEQTPSTGGGTSVRVVERENPTIPVPNDKGGVDERPNVSLEEEVVNAQVATYNAKANIQVLKAQDKLNKYLLDIQA